MRRVDLRRWAEVRAAFDTLVELDAIDRRSRLTALSSSDPELHAAVEAMFAADAEVDARLASLEATSIAQSPVGVDLFGLAGRTISHFEVHEPIGAGGMGVVYRAEDTRLGRAVALKFLLPNYGHDDAARARFLREAHSAAVLDHPNLCAVHEVGTSDDGWSFIAMPLYQGETLRARLTRDGAIPPRDALEIARQIAEGLRAAHKSGIVHRDLKPGNIMLLPDHTVRILDFGLAKAQSQALSETGGRLGTVSYMAPEQIRGAKVDGRADLWALGVVLYEMLTGRRPFGGEEQIAIAHAIVHEPPAPLAIPRSDTSARLSALIGRCLEKRPDDRPANAGEIVRALEDVRRGGNAASVLADSLWDRFRRHRHGLRWVGATTVVSVLAGALAIRGRHEVVSDERLVAVVPFRVAGADRSLHYLREGIVDLLAARLTGETRVPDPRSMLAAWRAAGGRDTSDMDRAAAVRLASRVGAREVLMGDITGGAGNVVLRATLVPVRGRDVRQATIEGRQDSILSLVDRLAVRVLALRAGHDTATLTDLSAPSFSAVRDYLEGQRLARLGQYRLAYDRYRSAANADSNFAAAWVGALDMTWWTSMSNDTAARALVRLRDRLPPAMRVMVDSRIGPRYPVFPSLTERRQLAEQATRLAPDNPYAWQYLGDVLFHWGAAEGIENVGRRAITAFQRTIALDSTFRTAVDHLPWLYYELGDTASMRRWLAASVEVRTPEAIGNRYIADMVLGDTKSAAQWRAAARDDFAALDNLMFVAEDLALPLQPLDSGMTAFISRAVTDRERFWSTWRGAGLAHARGQPNRAAKLLRAIPGIFQDDWPTQIFVLETVLAEGDSILGEQARRALDTGLASDCLTPFICTWFTAAFYDFMRGQPQTARMVLRRNRSAAVAGCWSEAPSMCAGYAMILEALLAAEEARPDARHHLARLDSMLRAAPVIVGPLLQVGNLVAARLWERSGDPVRALAAVRRRVRHMGVPEFQATYLREEGRLAAAAGDSEGAVRAYRRFLTLREDPEPALQTQVASVRRELARLER